MVMFGGMGKNCWSLWVCFFKIKKFRVKNCTRLPYYTLLKCVPMQSVHSVNDCAAAHDW